MKRNYIQETIGELRHVNWPRGRQITLYTVLVIVISLSVAAYLGLFDWVFNTLLEAFIF